MTNKSHDDNDYLLGERGVIIRPPRSRDIPSLAWKKREYNSFNTAGTDGDRERFSLLCS